MAWNTRLGSVVLPTANHRGTGDSMFAPHLACSSSASILVFAGTLLLQYVQPSENS
jgi:hypothetical protein